MVGGSHWQNYSVNRESCFYVGASLVGTSDGWELEKPESRDRELKKTREISRLGNLDRESRPSLVGTTWFELLFKLIARVEGIFIKKTWSFIWDSTTKV